MLGFIALLSMGIDELRRNMPKEIFKQICNEYFENGTMEMIELFINTEDHEEIDEKSEVIDGLSDIIKSAFNDKNTIKSRLTELQETIQNSGGSE